jgi:hypothetical protein
MGIKDVKPNYTPEVGIVCIRVTDGMLCMANQMTINHSVTSGNGELRPYHGNLRASLQERMLYVSGKDPNSTGSVKEALETGKFDIDVASRADLIELCMDEYGVDISMHKTRAKALEAFIEARTAAEGPPPEKAAPAAAGGLSAAA